MYDIMKDRIFRSIKKFIIQEKLELIVIGIITALFSITSHYLLPEHAKHYQYLASIMPDLVILIPIFLFSIKFAMLYKKTELMKDIELMHPLRDRDYNFKLVSTVFSASTFLMADIILVYAFAMSFFAFAFDAGTRSFPAVWGQIQMAEIAFPTLSIFSLVCMRRKY